MRYSAFFAFLFFCLAAFSQEQKTQTVRGTITDKQSTTPLTGATVVLLNSSPVKGTATDDNGNFRLENVPVGRQDFKVSYIGYKDIFLSNIIINSGKEVVLNIELEEEVVNNTEVVVKGNRNKANPNNELVTVSGRSFSIDETQRYAGSMGDPSRMAANFAGVAGGGNDQRNDIIIRGNSPLGLLWRLEGADIPNPNHFSNQGANGGPVSILNTNTLANSDFITGAWPAEYGNASSGVFDLKMRNGNNEKREYTAQIGFNGVELMAEGPLKKGGASYLVSYRYSTLAFFNALGIQFGESGIPYYQDLTMKLNFPRTKAGTFGIFAIGGKSNTTIRDSDLDSSELRKLEQPQNIQFSSRMGVAGLTHSIQVDKHSYIKTVLSVSGESNRTIVDTLSDLSSKATALFFSSGSQVIRNAAHTFYNRKINARNTFKAGMIITRFHSRMNDSIYRDDLQRYFTELDFDETLVTGQAYINWQHKVGTRFVINGGLHYNHLFLNNTASLEPRLGAKYALTTRQNISLGYGLHGQTQPLSLYFERTELPGGTVFTNKNLGYTKSHHLVGGYEHLLSQYVRLKTEAYFQYLTRVPVTQAPSSYSVINFGADFGGLPNIDSLVNRGLARNYGIELTLERFFDKGFYYLFTTSVFRSEYMASDGKWRSTAFNSNFVFNALAGYEKKVKENNVLTFNIKVTYAGGRREIPINLEQSRLEQRWVGDFENSYRQRLPAFFRTDFRIGYKVNKKRYTHEWALDIQNIFNIKNVLTREFNPATGEMKTIHQIAIFPVPLYRLQF